MSKILPEPVAKPLIAQLINHIGLTLQEQMIKTWKYIESKIL